MEYRDLYDNKRRPLNQVIQKGEKPKDGMYYVSVLIVLENSDGTFLLQKRTVDKGGLWGVISGHPKSGETSLEGMMEEMKEGMGICIPKELIKKFKTIQTKHKFVDFYYAKASILKEEIQLQQEEVADYMFASKDMVLKLIQENQFHYKHARMVKDCFQYLEKQKA